MSSGFQGALSEAAAELKPFDAADFRTKEVPDRASDPDEEG